ncbi:MAG: S9 family peptidase [Bacteroidia bacterium]|nr:S9 family peptidase [Bacteroidia bacterium]
MYYIRFINKGATYLLICSFAAWFLISCMKEKDNNIPPVAQKLPKILEKHGHKRTDPYFWMAERDSPEVLKYLKAENDYTQAMMKHTETIQNSLFLEMKNRFKEDDSSAPVLDGTHYYYSRFEPQKEYPIIARKKESLQAAEEILLNVPELAQNHSYFQLGDYAVSPNETKMAYCIDTLSRRLYQIHFKDLENKTHYQEVIENCEAEVIWANDNKTIFYIRKDLTTLRTNRIYSHILGTNPADDKLVYEEKDETFSLGIDKTKSQKFILIIANSTTTSEYLLIDADNPSHQPTRFLPRSKDHLYQVDHINQTFYIITNQDSAQNFQLMTVSDKKYQTRSAWEIRIPHRKEVLLEGIELFDNHLVIQERLGGLTQIRIINEKNKQARNVTFTEPAYFVFIGSNPNANNPNLRLVYTSMTTPTTHFDYNLETNTRTVIKEQTVLGGFSKENYITERIFAEAKDGTKIPISLVYHKGFKRDGSAPCYLYGYGSYGYSLDASFSSIRISLLDRGFVYAIAHVRGGQEMGRYWYEDGKLQHKKNTFTDFIACAEHLIAQKYTSATKLCASGGSAGGLLMGAVANMKPEIFLAIVANVPFVDVVTTMLDESIPLTTGEYDEWGNPNNPKDYEYILSYSPYDNVVPQKYPNMLVITGYHDSQVQYWEPAKWVAKLRATKTDNNKLLFYINMDSGHSGSSGRFESLKEDALEYAFLLDLLHISK